MNQNSSQDNSVEPQPPSIQPETPIDTFSDPVEVITFRKAVRPTYTPLQLKTLRQRRYEWYAAWGIGFVLAYTGNWMFHDYRIFSNIFEKRDYFLVLDVEKEFKKQQSSSDVHK